MKHIINKFIRSIDSKTYDLIRNSKGDAECRRFLREHLKFNYKNKEFKSNL